MTAKEEWEEFMISCAEATLSDTARRNKHVTTWES